MKSIHKNTTIIILKVRFAAFVCWLKPNQTSVRQPLERR